MKVVLGADLDGFDLKELVKVDLEEQGITVIDVSEQPSEDFVESSLALSKIVVADESVCGILFDGYGVGSYMASNKIQGMITANVTDENSAHMTKDHNNARAISIGANIVGPVLALRLSNLFVHGNYSGGRHQVRVDMLNKMI